MNMNPREITLLLILIKITAWLVSGCGNEDEGVRTKRDKISENLIIGMDYLGKPRVVCHCSEKDSWILNSNAIQANERTHIKVRDIGNTTEKEERNLIYAPSCCKIDLSNPNKLYSYPFTLRLPGQTYNDQLSDENSEEYQDLKNLLMTAIAQLLVAEGCVVSIDILKFRPGSVLVDIALTVKGQISQSIISTLRMAVESGRIGGLEVEIYPEPSSSKPTETSKPETTAQPPTNPPISIPIPQPTPARPAPSTTPVPGQTRSLTLIPTPTTGAAPTVTATPALASILVVTLALASSVPQPVLGDATPAAGQTPSPGQTSANELQELTTTYLQVSPTAAATSNAPSVQPVATGQTPSPGQTSANELQELTPTYPQVSPTAAATSNVPSVQPVATASPPIKSTYTTPAPEMRPEKPVDSRPTTAYETNKLGKEFKVAIVLAEKSFDAALNNPSSSQFLELKEIIEKSLTQIFKINPYFLFVNVVSFRPAVFKAPEKKPANVQMRDEVKLQGVEVTLVIKFREERPSQLIPLETQLKLGTIASHKVLQELAGVIIKEQDPLTLNCPSPCAPTCAPGCGASCCALSPRTSFKH